MEACNYNLRLKKNWVLIKGFLQNQDFFVKNRKEKWKWKKQE